MRGGGAGFSIPGWGRLSQGWLVDFRPELQEPAISEGATPP